MKRKLKNLKRKSRNQTNQRGSEKMKHAYKPLLILMSSLCLCFISCGKSYQNIPIESLTSSLASYEGKNVTLSGVPTEPKEGGFSPPTPIYDGYWKLMVNGVACVEKVNFENEPRIRAARRLAAKAKQSGKPVTLSGVVKRGLVEMDSFEGVKTKTPFLKSKDQYYSYLYFYEWSPFAYKLNDRAMRQ